MTPACVNLRERYGDRFRIWNELEDRRARLADDPWDLILQGRSGFVAPHGGELLVACTNSRTTTRRILAAVPGAVVVQDGSDGQNITFDAAHLDAVAGLLRLRRRRRLTEEQRQAAAARRAAFSFPSRTSERQNPPEIDDPG